ncbi:hypothetical protein [Macrococcus sp. DPC7161]|uniref:hypothetical protein n=1 Tax=Macrococcus sp. DPC7161 TaxID=2507060 RepID=UPI00100C0C62|nr:hypothetical protein [Macrococcus sp. DPC7161]RXK18615.1 hypothetical protein ER639_04910 [Macrococcus sp. DPC7161]
MIKAMLKMEWRSFINSFKALSGATKALTIIGYLAIFIVLAPMIVGFISLGYQLPKTNIINLTAYIALFYFLIIFVSSITTIINDFFIANDIKQLLTLPIGIQHVFTVKMLKLWFMPLFWLYLLISVTMSFNLYAIVHSMLTVIKVMITMLGLTMIYIVLTFGFVFLLTKLIPKSKIKEIMTAVLGLVGACSYFIYLGIGNKIIQNLPKLPDYLPFNFIAKIMINNLNGYIDVMISGLILLVGIVLHVLMYRLLIKYGKDDFTTETIKKRSKKYTSTIMTPEQAFRMKDKKLLLRDFREISAVLPQVIIPIPYFIFVIMQSGGIHEMLSWTDEVKATTLFGIATAGTGYVVITISSMFAAKDAEQYDLLYSLPIDFKDVVRAKWKSASLTSGTLFSIPLVIFGIVIQANPLFVVCAIISAYATAFSLSLLGIKFGITEPQISKKNPGKRISTGMGFVSLLTVMGFIGLIVAVQFLIGALGLALFIRFIVLTVIVVCIGAIIYFVSFKACVKQYEQKLKITYVD